MARLGRTPLARWRLAWRRMAWPSLTLSLGHDAPESFSTAPTHAARARGIGHAATQCDIASKVRVA
jgi:hypothetical protein